MSDQKVISLPHSHPDEEAKPGYVNGKVFLTPEEGTKLLTGYVSLQDEQNKLRKLEGLAKVAEGNFKVAQSDYVDHQLVHRKFVAELNNKYQIDLYKNNIDPKTFEVFREVPKADSSDSGS